LPFFVLPLQIDTLYVILPLPGFLNIKVKEKNCLSFSTYLLYYSDNNKSIDFFSSLAKNFKPHIQSLAMELNSKI
jgi:hypothetical protein